MSTNELLPIMYIAPPPWIALQSLKVVSTIFTLSPVMNNAPPSTLDASLPSAIHAEEDMKVDLEIVISGPVRQILPPRVLEVLPSGLSILIPLLSMNLVLDIIPLAPSAYIAPPSSPATLLVNVESTILKLCSEVEVEVIEGVVESMYIAPPSPKAELLMKFELNISTLPVVVTLSAAPSVPLALTKLMFFNTTCELPHILKMDA